MTRAVWQTTLLFTCLGVLWIVITDQALLWLGVSITPSEVLMYQTAKGIGFVLLVGLLLFLHLSRITKKLRNREQAYRKLFEGNPQPAIIFDQASLQILAVNEAARHMYGYTQEEFLKLSIKDLRPPEEVPRFLAHLKPVTGFYQHGVWVHKLKDGTKVRVEITSQETEFDGHTARMAVINDLTELYRIQERADLDRDQVDKLKTSMSILQIRMDAEGTISETNPAFRRHFPVSRQKEVPEFLKNYVVESDQEILRNCLHDAQNTSSNRAFCTLTHTTPGSEQSLYISWEVNWINHSSSPTFLLIGYDVTEKYQSRKELEEANKWLRLLLSSVTDGFFALNAKLNVTYANAAFQRLTGKTEKQLVGSSVFDTFPKARETGVLDRIEKVMETKESDTYESYSPTLGRWYRGIAYPFEDGAAIFFRDITEEREMEEQLQFTQEHLQALTNSAQDRIWSVDRDLNFVFFNGAFKQFYKTLLGSEPNLGEPCLPSELPAERAQQLKAYYQRAFNGESFEIEDDYILTGQQNITIIIALNPIVGRDGQVHSVGCISHDITMRKAREELLRKQNELLKEIARLSAHETRRPVANIMGLVEVMAREHPDYVAKEPSFQYLLQEAKDLDTVVRLITQKVTDAETSMRDSNPTGN